MPEFETLVERHRGELFAHCYRMLGSPQDAEDALQEALLGAWQGYAGFEGRSSVRTWLYTVATRACLRQAERSRRWSSPDLGPGFTQTADLGEPRHDVRYVEPWATSAEHEYLARESVELAFVEALQRLPGTQRAVLLLRDVLRFSAVEVAGLLDTSVASVNSALQRARATLGPGVEPSVRPDDADVRRIAEEFAAAWQDADVDRLAGLLADDARFTMPPLPAWFDGRPMVVRFLAERVFETPWRLHPREVNGQPAFYCEQEVDGVLRPGAVNVLTVRGGLVTAISSWVDPAVVEKFVADR